MNTQLFRGEKARLTALNPDKDAETLSAWSHDADFLHRTTTEAAKPISPAAYKKKIDEWMKEMNENKLALFGVRLPGDDRLVGVAQFYWIEWQHGTAHFNIGIGKPQDRNAGVGSEVVRMMLRYGFLEMNLHRIGLHVAAWNTDALRFFARFGFAQEFCRREALYYMGRFYDHIGLSLLREEWHGN